MARAGRALMALPLSYSGQYAGGALDPAAATFAFTGESVTYFYTKAHNRGKAGITIDGTDLGNVDLFAPSGLIEWQASTRFSGLGLGIHHLHISALQDKNPRSEGHFIDVDAIQAGYRPHGLNFSPFVDGQDPNRGAQVSEQQIRERLKLIAPDADWVRSFGSTGGLENFARIAREFGFKVAAGAWLGRDLAANEREISHLVRAMKAGEVDLAIAGSEVLLRGDLTPQQLIGYMQRLKREAPGIPVTTADVYGQLLANRAVVDESDLVLTNVHPYWEGVSMDAAVCAVDRAYKSLKAQAGNKAVMISETGWPSCGVPQRSAIPSPENAAAFFLRFTSWARANNVPYFYFQALDESWKAAYEGPQGACWGIRDKHGNLKPGMQDVFSGRSISIDCGSAPSAGRPAIEFTFVPRYGSFEDLRGVARGVQPNEAGVAVYIKVGAGWWSKPYADAAVTAVQADGSWICDITTGGSDQAASEIAALLIPAGYQPPILLGSGAIPTALIDRALASISVRRELP